jgi:alpha-mannosidase
MTLWPDDPLIAFHLTTRHVLGRWLRLRAAFFTDLRQGRAIHEIAFGRFERPAGEFAAQNYMALVGPDKGLALLNRGLPGNNATDGVLLLSLMRSVNMDTRVGAESDMSLEDGTQHVFDYAVLPFGGERELDACGLARRGQEFACPPYVFERHPDRLAADAPRGLPAADGILDVEPGNVVCTAFYSADDGLVARLYESEGRPTRASVLPRFPRAAVFETDAMLRGRRPLPGGDAIQVTLKPFEIKTLLIEPAATP